MISNQKHLEVYGNTIKVILIKIVDSKSFKFKVKIIGKAPDDGNTKDVEIIVPLKYLSNF